MLDNQKFLLQKLKNPNIELLKEKSKDEIIKLVIYHFNHREKLRQQWLETLIENDFLKRQHDIDTIKIKQVSTRNFANLETRRQYRHKHIDYKQTVETEKQHQRPQAEICFSATSQVERPKIRQNHSSSTDE
jgi:hypothetical protein